jgi:putative transcriptional regulator
MNASPAPYGALLMDFAAGALAPAQTLLVETHLRLRPEGRETMAALDAAGGALLESIDPAAIAARPLAAVEAVAPEPATADDRLIEARALIEAAARQPDALSWRWRAPGLRELNLPFAGSSLIRLAGGRALAAHGHTGEEITLVLRGTFSDQAGCYGVGDIGFADTGYDHSPLVPPGDDCVCLVAMTGRVKFHNPVARIAARLLA